MHRLAPLLLLLSAGCASDEAPPACVEMCVAAAGLYGACLSDWGADWEAAGYADEDDFLGACETWAWEMSLLEIDAVERGEADASGSLVQTCEARESAFKEEDASCDAYTEVDWNARPWDPVSTGPESG
jgi:hypothetical protein